MKVCKFTLNLDNGTQVPFDNELQLTEALLEKYRFVPKYGDIVFDNVLHSTAMLQARKIIDDNNLDFQEMLDNHQVTIEAPANDFDTETYVCHKAGVAGTNKFMASLCIDDDPDHPIFPLFNQDNYWNNQFKKWKAGEMTDEQRAELSDLLGREVTTIEDKAEQDLIRKTYTEKWKAQGHIGNTLHAVMCIFFSDTEKSKKGIGNPVREMKGDLLKDYIKKRLPKNPSDPDKKIYEEISDEQLDELIEYAQKLYQDFKVRFGENAIYMPEIAMMTPLTKPTTITRDDGTTYTADNMMGVLDLVVIDSNGNIQIVDYKTSPKPYSNYDDAKKRTFYYQLASYRRLLQRAGANLGYKAGLYIAPMELQGFRKEGDVWTYDKLKGYEKAGVGNNETTQLVDLSHEILGGPDSYSINYNLDKVLPEGSNIKVAPTGVLEYVHNWMAKWFKEYGTYNIDKEVIQYVKDHGLDKRNNQNKFEFTAFYPRHKTFQADRIEELYKPIKEQLEQNKKQRGNWVRDLKRQIANAKATGQTSIHFTGITENKGKDPDWLTHTLEKYVNGHWEIQNEGFETLESLGMLVMRNTITQQLEVIKVSNKPVHTETKINNRENITGVFEPDIVEDNNDRSLILKSNWGNIELMEAMLALNQCPSLFDNNQAGLSQILVLDMLGNTSMPATNAELMYNFNKLAKLSKLPENNFSTDNPTKKPRIKMMSFLEVAKDHLYEILYEGNTHHWTTLPEQWKDLQSASNNLERVIENPSKARAALLALAQQLESKLGVKGVQKNPYSAEQEPAKKLLQEIYFAISEIDGYDVRQQTVKDAQWFDDLKKVIVKGHSGTDTDNQGFLQNPALNRLAKATTIAYQNTRDAVQRVKNDLRPLLENLKKDANLGYLYERTLFNQTDLYKGLIYQDRSGDILFRNPDSDPKLSTAQREFLRHILYRINVNRFVPKDMQSNEQYIADTFDNIVNGDDPTAYYRVPLKLASKASKASNKGGLSGMFSGFKEILKAWNPNTAADYVKEHFENFIDGEGSDKTKDIQENNLWEMTNIFDRGEGSHRLAYIEEKGGLEAFETNIEELLLHQTFAYEQQNNLNEIFPMIRATMMNAAAQGLIQNTEYTNTLEYISKYVRNKIFNQSLVDPTMKGSKIVLGKLQSFASALALAFSPSQFYQHLDGFWKDISLFIRKPDGETSFTFANLKDAWIGSYRDMVMQWGNGNSVVEMLNEYYGINDMDMNSYVDKIKQQQGFFYNFDSLMFRFASRPDFYNRMTIFTAQMRGDGCYDAHYKDKNGKLCYDWTLDKRFDLFSKIKPADAKKLTGDQLKKYQDQAALYYAMAEQMVREHTRDSNGKLFEIDMNDPKPLPKAYTTEQSEGMKALGDMIYGYYSHEKKSLMQSTTIGSLFMQMNTYWSSKKNQFLAPGGIKYMGRMEHYSEPERDENNQIVLDEKGNAKQIKYYQVTDGNGNLTGEIVSDKDLEANEELREKVIPFMQWKGQFHEGIFVTLMNQFRSLIHSDKESIGDKFKDVHNQYWNNPDENLRRAYRSNIKQFWYDLFGWLLIGCIFGPALEKAARDYMKDNGNDSLDEAIQNSIYTVAAHCFSTSGADFNALKSIGGIGVSWTPFSVQTFTRLTQNFVNVLGGDKSFYDAMISTSAATRSMRPLFDYIGDETGWNVARNDEVE